MVILALQIHVLRQRKWAILKTFAPEERGVAWKLYASLDQAAGYDGKKFVEEGVRDNGLLVANTVSFLIFEPRPDGQAGATASPEGRRFAASGPRRPRTRGGVVERLLGLIGGYRGLLVAPGENAFRRTKNSVFAPVGDERRMAEFNWSTNPWSQAYTRRYGDEGPLTVNELIRAESTEVLGTAFFTFLRQNLDTDGLRDDLRFRIGICCFVVGAFVRIEQEFELESDRGKALLTDALRIFLDDETAVQAFIVRMAGFLAQPASARYIKAGARCFELFEAGDVATLGDRFRAAFRRETVSRDALSETHEVGLFVVQIADPVWLRAEYGNVGVQKVLDHLADALRALELEHGGRTLKVMGDSYMCATRRPGAMIRIALALLRGDQKGDRGANLPPHDLCVGGWFGPAIRKDGDYFGMPVHLAASLVAAARPGEACFPAHLEETVDEASATVVRRSKVGIEGSKEELVVLHLK